MCGIVGLYVKNPELRQEIGGLFRPMLEEMTSRGPDSAGIAIYRDAVDDGETKLSLAHDDANFGWTDLAVRMGAGLAAKVTIRPIGGAAIARTDAEEASATAWLSSAAPDVRIVGAGRSLEIYKDTGLPSDVYDRFELDRAEATHMIGHTRMATESAVTSAGSHPFGTGADLCLVHNGSLSNHNRLRETLQKEGLQFQTDNDTEVAAAYLTWKLRQGATIDEALTDGMRDLDGFYTFCIGTSDGFTVLRDPIACKHAVLAETDDWVAMATEYRAIGRLPEAETATIWEPKPATIYTWGGNRAGA